MAVPIWCATCGSSYRIPKALFSSRFAGKETSIKCRNCGAPIVVDGELVRENVDTVDDRARRAREAETETPASIAVPPADAPSPDTLTPQSDVTKPPGSADAARERAPDGGAGRPAPRGRASAWTLVLLALGTGALWLVFLRARPGALAPQAPAAATAPLESAAPLTALPAASEPARPVTAEPAMSVEPAAGVQPDTRAKPDTHVLEAALGRALARAAECHADGRPSGTARITLTFAPNGKVSAARLDGRPISTSPVSRCILAHMQAVSIPAFAGPEFTVVRELSLP